MLFRVTVPLLVLFSVLFNVGYGGRFRRQGNFIWGTDDFEPSAARPAVPSATNFGQEQQQQQQQSSAFADCTRNCQTTSQYDPVCGSDRETYSNPERLACARKCGKIVQQEFRGSCAPL
ncbi:uncharacterized protein LOC112904279 [Agrilus planipennis]|uniref:Uncharacterized protein LOC108732288 n=1 Tax=Agrilus planipennis TaxID=224129 RepID=A0A1W4W2U1_AGRPL|nr:uncharacterized protein LOC108732288 [Agrilus planipennis]XP_025829707.1 uncharacterized protein LOC112904279 [Agrilus planipennis]